MINKKIIALVLTICIALTFSTAALAAPGNGSEIVTKDVAVITVYGYVGSDVHTVPTDPETPLEIYVEVPVQFLFAAFESDDGAITSPKFTISNLSETTDVMVEIENFEQRADCYVELAGQLSLKILNAACEPVVDDLMGHDYSESQLLSGRLARYTEGFTNNKFEFIIGGFWSGLFNEELTPTFEMTVKFTAVP